MPFDTLFKIEPNRFYPFFGEATSLREPSLVINNIIMTLAQREGLQDVPTEYEGACDFLYTSVISASSGAASLKLNTFQTYRSEVNKLCNWAWLVKGKSVTSLRRTDIMEFLTFCSAPPKDLVTKASYSYFDSKGEINEKWKPFVNRNGGNYTRKPKAIETQLSALSSFYDHLIEEEYETTNPAKQALKKININQSASADSTFIGVDDVGKALTTEQWEHIWKTTEMMATEKPEKHERTRFIMLMLYWHFLRISEISYRSGYTPYFGHFCEHPKKKGLWLLHIPNSKGGKKRTIGVPKPVLDGLVRYRTYRGLSPYPAQDERVPIFPRLRAATHGRDAGIVDSPIGTDAIFEVVKEVYRRAAETMEQMGLFQDADRVRSATIHQLRHTGITHDLDVRNRSLEAVCFDAGHSSTAVTSLYVTKNTLERHLDSANKC